MMHLVASEPQGRGGKSDILNASMRSMVKGYPQILHLVMSLLGLITDTVTEQYLLSLG